MEGRRDEASEVVAGNWADLPGRPSDIPWNASFALTEEEGRYLRERVELSHRQSYLAHILLNGRAGKSLTGELPWDHPAAETAPTSVRTWLNDAQLFSLVHQGGVLLYDLMLAELLNDDDGKEEFSRRLANWSDAIAAVGRELYEWDRASMWRRLLEANPRLRPRTREFADHWFGLVSTLGSGPIQDQPEAQRMVRERERTLKGARARLTYAEARDRRRGYPFAGRLEYRWTQVQRISADILSAVEGS